LREVLWSAALLRRFGCFTTKLTNIKCSISRLQPHAAARNHFCRFHKTKINFHFVVANKMKDGISEIEGKAARVAASESVAERVLTQGNGPEGVLRSCFPY
jgi:hypothetical protein